VELTGGGDVHGGIHRGSQWGADLGVARPPWDITMAHCQRAGSGSSSSCATDHGVAAMVGDGVGALQQATE
jgi:hypothetical protein